MLQKDTLRLIKKTFNRFFSLLMIVLIGVAFMMGLLSTRAIMETSVDIYNDKYDLHDVQVYSSYGFDEADIEAFSKQDFVDKYFASKMVDAYSMAEDGFTAVTRVEEIKRDVDKYELIEGSLPKNEKEILVLNGSLSKEHYSVGDHLTIYLEDGDIRDSLKNDEYVICGIVKSPQYLSHTLGTGLLKNLELSLVVFVPNTNFISEYYTTVYFTTPDGKNFNAYEEEYEAYMDEVLSDTDYFAKTQQDKVKDKILKKYKDEIKKGEEELEKQKAEGQAQLDAAKAQLDNANIQIIAGETQLSSLNSVLREAKTRQQALESKYSSSLKPSMDKIKKIEQSDPKKRPFDEIYSELLADYGTYTALSSLNSSDIEGSGIKQIKARIKELNSHAASLNTERAQQEATRDSADASAEEKAQAAARIAAIDAELAETNAQISAYTEILNTYESQKSSVSPKALMDELNKKYGGSIASRFNEYSDLQKDRLIYETMQQEMKIANDAVRDIEKQLADAKAGLAAGKAQYEAGLEAYKKGQIEFDIEIEKAEIEIRKAYQDLEELPAAEWTILGRDDHYSSYLYSNNAKQMGAIGIAMPLLFYLVAALVCMTTMTRLVDEQRGQIGVLRALGFSKGQVISKYVIYALLATLIGSVIGLFIGMGLFPTVIYTMWRLMYDLPPIHMFFPVKNIVICFVAFAALMAGVTYLVVRKSLKEVPSQLMRPKAPKNARKVFLEYFTGLWNRMSFTSKITARNLIRYKGRFIMTVIGVAGCTGLLVVGWGIKDSISEVVGVQYGEIFNYNYSVSLEEDADTDHMVSVLEKNLDNEYVTPLQEYSSKVYFESSEPTINVVTSDARDMNDVFHLRATDGETELKVKNNGVIISQKFAKNNGLKKGDRITVESRGGIKAEVKVADVCEMYFQHYMFMSDEYYYSVFGEKPIHSTVAVKNTAGSELAEGLESVDGFVSVLDFSTLIDQFNTMIKALNFIILVIILTAGSLAFVVLVNLTQVNISERVREIATLKVLGFRRGEVYSYIFKEIFLLSLIGGIVGLPLGVIEHHFIMNIINMDMIMFGHTLKPLTFVYAFAVTIAFTLIVMFMTRKSLRRIEMIESLKSVE